MDVPLCQGCRARDAILAQLQARVAALGARCAEQDRLLVDLARKLQDKDLPSTAPRSQEPATPPPAKKASGRKPGGQPGHSPHLKQLLPAERVTATVPLVPTRCPRCHTLLPVERGPDDPEPTRFRVAELPDLKAKITEYQRHSHTCPCCGQVNQAALPEDFPTHSIHRLRNAAVVRLLVGRTLRGILWSDRWQAYEGVPLRLEAGGGVSDVAWTGSVQGRGAAVSDGRERIPSGRKARRNRRYAGGLGFSARIP